MDHEMKSQAFEIILTRYIIDAPNFEKVTENIKEEMDEQFGGKWHCIMGKGFGFEVTFESNNLLFLCIDEVVGVLLWQC